MSANEAGPNLDRATFQKLAVASLVPALAAIPAAVEAMKPQPTPTPTPYAFTEEDFEKLLEALVSGITKILSDIEPMIQLHDRCPPYKQQAKNCPAFHDAIKNLKDFSNSAGQKSY
jgi:hypothetical protein